jgi:hypothetical protein
VRYRIVDYFDRTVVDKTMQLWHVPTATTETRELAVSELDSGAYRLLIDSGVRMADGTRTLPVQEYSFCVLVAPPKRMHRTLGAYINLSPEPVAVMSRAGIRRTMTLSSGNDKLSVWQHIQPQRDRFVWWDEAALLAKEHDMEIVANLELQSAPKWALKPRDADDAIRFGGAGRAGKGTFSRRAMVEFVEAMVSHYKETVHTWVLVDEPYHYFSMDEYYKVVKAASQAAKRADPSCRVFCHGAYYPANLPRLEELGVAQYVDGVSGYARNPQQGKKLSGFASRNGTLNWTVEYSWQVSMLQTLETPEGWQNHSSRSPVSYRGNGARLAQLPVSYMTRARASGFNRYDARYPGGDFTQLDNYKSMFEYDGSLKPSAVAYAVAARLLDGFQGVEELTLHPQFDTFLLADDSRFILAFWTKEKTAVRALLTPPEGVTGYDIMGRRLRVTPAPALLGTDIAYLIGPMSQLPAARSMLASLAVSPVLTVAGETVLDETSNQYLYRARLSNTLADEPVQVTLELHGPVRNQWGRRRDLTVAPGQTATVSFGLNAYGSERLPRRAGRYELVLRAYGSSVLVGAKLGEDLYAQPDRNPSK